MQGIEGVLVPYSIATDNVMTLLLIACLATTIAVLMYMRRKMVLNITMVRCQWFLAVEMCLMYAILYFVYLSRFDIVPLSLHPDLQMGIFFLTILLFFVAKRILTRAVSLVFFNREAVRRFTLDTLFFMGIEGLCLVPAVYLCVYLHLRTEYVLIYALGILILFRFLTFFKQKQIFFRNKNGFVGFFIYLCTLEIIPFFALWSVMAIISGNLIKNVLV